MHGGREEVGKVATASSSKLSAGAGADYHNATTSSAQLTLPHTSSTPPTRIEPQHNVTSTNDVETSPADQLHAPSPGVTHNTDAPLAQGFSTLSLEANNSAPDSSGSTHHTATQALEAAPSSSHDHFPTPTAEAPDDTALYTLVTDQVFLQEPSVVWERIEDVDGAAGGFVDGEFLRFVACFAKPSNLL